jgi:hypothetical protein
MAEIPDVAEVREWAAVSLSSLSDVQIQQIINAEEALQAAACEVSPVYPDALAQALLRRAAREIAARQLPVGLSADTGGEYAPIRLPSFDAEIERLEAPYRIIVVA